MGSRPVRRILVRTLLCALALVGAGLGARADAQNAITLDPVAILDLAGTVGGVRIDTDAPATSVFLSISYDPAVIEPGSFTAIGAASAAEGVFPNVLPTLGGLVCGLILDVQPPFDGQTIPPGTDLLVLGIEWLPVGGIPSGTSSTALDFVDGVFDSPPVTNTINQSGGTAVTAANGLVLTGATVTIEEPAPPTFRLTPTEIVFDTIATIPVTLDNPSGEISAYTLSLDVPAELEVLSFDTSGTITGAVGAELITPDLSHPGISVDVLLDAFAPFDGQTIPLGTDIPLLGLITECIDPPLAPDPELLVAFGWSTLESSTITAGGVTIDADTEDALITCHPVPLSPVTFAAGTLGTGGTVEPVSAAAGDVVELGIHYTDPGEGVAGVSVTLCVDCALANFVPGSVNAIGDALDESEFVQANFDTDPNDGDGCEFALGALLDFQPPFDGATLPITLEPSRLFRLELAIDPAAAPGTVIPVPFCDDIDASGSASVANSIIVGTSSFSNFAREDGQIVLDAGIAFRRGDVDNSGTLNIADAVVTLQYLFAGGAEPSCRAAADFDASGDLQLNDPIGLLGFLFASGPPPAAPYPDCGTSPTEDCTSAGGC